MLTLKTSPLEKYHMSTIFDRHNPSRPIVSAPAWCCTETPEWLTRYPDSSNPSQYLLLASGCFIVCLPPTVSPYHIGLMTAFAYTSFIVRTGVFRPFARSPMRTRRGRTLPEPFGGHYRQRHERALANGAL